jgi:peptide subunit release factor 1 (eRF1)
MISKSEIESLVQREPVPDSPILSLYLDVDQSNASNLNRNFQSALKDMLRSIELRLEGAQLEHFSADAARVQDYGSHLELSGKGLVLFADASENFFWSREFQVPVRSTAHWNDTPYVKPLFALIDDYERYGVVLVDKERGRLFTVFMGEIVEHQDFLAPLPVRRIKSPGTDQMYSERRFQNRASTHVHLHLKHVAESLDRLVDQYGFDRILIAGPVEATGELHHLLSKRVRGRLVEHISLPVTASAHRILEETLRIGERLERQVEEEIVQDLIAGDHRHHPFALGLEGTVHALCEERIWRMIYANGFTPTGGQCSKCRMLFAKPNGACEYCGASITRTDDLMELMVERALEQDSLLEEVAGNAATRLQQAGGIGAILRF